VGDERISSNFDLFCNELLFFKDAVKTLNETKIACPIYYIISGPGVNDGIVIERNTDSIHGFY